MNALIAASVANFSYASDSEFLRSFLSRIYAKTSDHLNDDVNLSLRSFHTALFLIYEPRKMCF